ncbi:unnamed protein product [Citrullus colocynthis]|uniref:Uncharacterized protein n=1 Tax=Citrullus colocynthis TaxID=252529 RepID=A0ABP0Y3A6_9ROSI
MVRLQRLSTAENRVLIPEPNHYAFVRIREDGKLHKSPTRVGLGEFPGPSQKFGLGWVVKLEQEREESREGNWKFRGEREERESRSRRRLRRRSKTEERESPTETEESVRGRARGDWETGSRLRVFAREKEIGCGSFLLLLLT